MSTGDLIDVAFALSPRKSAPVDKHTPIFRVSLYDSRSGRLLSANTGRSVALVFGSGVVTNNSVFHLLKCVDGSIIIQLADLSAYIGLDTGGNDPQLRLVKEPEDAAPFELVDSSTGIATSSNSDASGVLSSSQSETNVSLRIAGTRCHVVVSTDKKEGDAPLACIGRSGEGGASLAFVLSPLLASTNVRWTMTQMNEKLVSLWGGEDLGFIGAHPMKLFNLGGEVKSREHKLGEWQCFTVVVLNARHNLIALRSSHGFYLCADREGKMVANRKVADAWETFELIQVDSSSVALRTSHGTIVSLHGGADVIHKSCIISDSERLVLFCGASAKAQYYSSNPAGKLPASRFGDLSPLRIEGILLGSLAVAGVVAGSIVYAALEMDKVATHVPQKANEMAASSSASITITEIANIAAKGASSSATENKAAIGGASSTAIDASRATIRPPYNDDCS